MGTWGDGPFDDDGAADWGWEVQEAPDWGVVEAALHAAADAGDYLDGPDGQIAWAAAAVVAAVDDDTIEVPDGIAGWLTTHRSTRPETLRPLAVQALRRLLADNSELAELWAEADQEATWREHVQKLAARLE